MRAEDLREFAARSRSDVAAAKRFYWQTVARSGEGLGAFEAGQALYDHAKAVSDFPSKSYQAEDLAHHVHLKELIDRASQAAPFARPAR